MSGEAMERVRKRSEGKERVIVRAWVRVRREGGSRRVRGRKQY